MLKLKELREKKGFSQKDLAANLNISPNTVSQYENSIREPKLEIILSLCKLLDTSIDYLLTGKESNIQAPNLTPSELNFLQMYRKLDAVDKKYQYDALKLKYDDIKTFVDSSYPKYDECDDIKKSTQNAQ